MARKYEQISEPIPELAQLIYIYNLIPANFRLDDLYLIMRKENISPVDALNIALQKTPEKFQRYIKNHARLFVYPPGENHLTMKMIRTYQEIYQMRVELVGYLQHLERQRRDFQQNENFHISVYDTRLVLRTTVFTDENGNDRISGIAPLIGKFDKNRLQMCIGQHIFWQKTTKSETCGKQKCVNDLANEKRRFKKLQEKKEKEINESARKKKRKEWNSENFSKEKKGDEN